MNVYDISNNRFKRIQLIVQGYHLFRIRIRSTFQAIALFPWRLHSSIRELVRCFCKQGPVNLNVK